MSKTYLRLNRCAVLSAIFELNLSEVSKMDLSPLDVPPHQSGVSIRTEELRFESVPCGQPHDSPGGNTELPLSCSVTLEKNGNPFGEDHF